MRFLSSTLPLLAALLPFVTAEYDKTACNSSPSLCDKIYPSILHLGTHDSAFVRTRENSFSAAGNQYFDVKTQLGAGIRLLQNQLQLEGSDIRLCHTACALFDAGVLEDYLKDVVDWLNEHPSEVLTLIYSNPDKVGPDRLTPIYEKVGLDKMSFLPVAGEQWPTLRQMIDNNTRVVTFLADSSVTGTYILPQWQYVFETSFENFAPEDLTCARDRGPKQGIGMINNFMYTTINKQFEIYAPNDTFSETLNTEVLEERLGRCKEEWGTEGGFVLVDFFDAGEPMAVVDRANGVEGEVTNREKVGERESKEGDGLGKLNEEVSAGGRVRVGAWVWAVGKWSGGFGRRGVTAPSLH